MKINKPFPRAPKMEVGNKIPKVKIDAAFTKTTKIPVNKFTAMVDEIKAAQKRFK